MEYQTLFAMQNHRALNDLSSIDQPDRLMSETDAEDRCFRLEPADDFDADPSIFGTSWAGRKYDAARIQCFDFLDRNFVVAHHFDIPVKNGDRLVKVVSK